MFRARSFDARHFTFTHGRMRKRVLLAMKCRRCSFVFLSQPMKISRDFADHAAGVPPQTGYRAITAKGDVGQMVANNLSISQIMIMLDKASVKRFKFATSDKLQLERFEFRERAGNWSYIDINCRN